ncbi:MAG: hypothetical protein RR231_06665, partial [Acinetobacter sp.]
KINHSACNPYISHNYSLSLLTHSFYVQVVGSGVIRANPRANSIFSLATFEIFLFYAHSFT